MYLFYAVTKLIDSLFSSLLQGIKMTSHVTSAILSQQALTEKLNEMVRDGLGFGQPVNEGVTNLFKDKENTYYCVNNSDYAHVGYIPEKHKTFVLTDKRKRISITNGITDIIKFVMDEFLTPAGISWAMSTESPNVGYMQSVTDQILDIYMSYISDKEPGASIACVVEPVASKTQGFAVNMTYEVFCDKQNTVVCYRDVELLSTLVQNVSNGQIDAMAQGVSSILNAAGIGTKPFSNSLDNELFYAKLDMPRVLMQTMRVRGIGSNDPSKLFDIYVQLLNNNIETLPSKSFGTYNKTWQTLNAMEQSYVKTLCNCCMTLYKACLESNIIEGKQVATSVY